MAPKMVSASFHSPMLRLPVIVKENMWDIQVNSYKTAVDAEYYVYEINFERRSALIFHLCLFLFTL